MIVDDSRVMRAWLRSVLTADPRLIVADEACDAQEARDKLRERPVDVLTLDIEMPGMNGIEFLTRLMRARPMPVVMFSSHTAEGSDAAIQSLSLGAVDCMVKPTHAFGSDLLQDLRERVYQAACTRPLQLSKSASPPQSLPNKAPVATGPDRRGSIILIGASTGGVAALETLLPGLKPDGPPVVIVQHMPGNFLLSFAGRLDRMLHQNVRLAKVGVPLQRGDIVLAPGDGQHTQIKRRGGVWECNFAPNEPPALHCPAVDMLFLSAVSEAKHVAAAILTGLGRDGSEGLSALRAAGARTFGQDAASCVVYGMPRAAKAAGAVEQELPLDQIAAGLSTAFQRRPALSTTQAPLRS
jgi:two-component system chemotaxis response regulator CheB